MKEKQPIPKTSIADLVAANDIEALRKESRWKVKMAYHGGKFKDATPEMMKWVDVILMLCDDSL